VLNAPGTIDSDYRGEVGVVLINLGQKRVIINRGDRIAQLAIARVPDIELSGGRVADKERGEGGFGSTG
jgi:dUTP pyrophosphatase